jgi:TM2 domain-containing membrane protein YozV
MLPVRRSAGDRRDSTEKMQKSSKKYATAVCLSGIFGILGIHHFYLGRWFHGMIDFSMTIGAIIFIGMGMEFLGFLLLGIDIIHTFIVTILLLIGAYKDGIGNVVTYPGQVINKTDSWRKKNMEKSEKGFVPTLLLCFFLGGLGVHRFYVGKVGTGILMLLTLGGLGVWALIDFVMIACGSFKDGQGLPIKN